MPKTLPNKFWNNLYKKAPDTLAKMSKTTRVACAFNSCIDSVVKLSGKEFCNLFLQQKSSLKELKNVVHSFVNSPLDLLRGIFRCFTNGIAEEWIAEQPEMLDWMLKNLGVKKIQVGGQGGIIANTLSLTGIKQIIVHSNALSKLQATQFFDRKNLLSFDQHGNLKQASKIDRDKISSIHWIVEFDKGDKITLEGQEFICPKSNRFIITYDPPLFNFVIDKNFINYTNNNKFDYFVLSGYQALNSKNNALKHIKNSVKIIDDWKKQSPQAIVHLEIASTQDRKVLKNLTQYLAPKVDSIGVNERETMDILEVINQKKLLEKCKQNPTSSNLFDAILKIKTKLKCPRIQLHMFGLYITIQNKNYPLSPTKNRNGMILAATSAAGKALHGQLSQPDDILKAYGMSVSDIGIKELQNLSSHLKKDTFLTKGICEYKGFDIIAVPTILIDHPKTLVGMGDTISSFSLIGAH